MRVVASLIRRKVGPPLASVRVEGLACHVVADLRTPMGLGVYRFRRYEDEDFEVMREHLRPGDVFLDCGANVGMFTLAAAKMVGPRGRVIAFEPAPGTRLELMRNVAVNDLAQVTVLPYALSDHLGELPFTVMGHGGGLSSFAPAQVDKGTGIKVSVAPLDECLPPDLHGRVTFIKIDVEGAELATLTGAERLLRVDRPILLVEVEDEHLQRQHASAEALHAFLASHDYAGYPTPGPSPNYLFLPNAQRAGT